MELVFLHTDGSIRCVWNRVSSRGVKSEVCGVWARGKWAGGSNFTYGSFNRASKTLNIFKIPLEILSIVTERPLGTMRPTFVHTLRKACLTTVWASTNDISWGLNSAAIMKF